MKKILLIIFTLSAGLSGLRAQETSVTAGLDASSAYAFHGMTYNKNAVLQPYMTVAHKSFVYNLWCNYNLKSDNNGLGYFPAGEFTEIDHFFTYLLPVKFADLDVTLGIYNYPMLGWKSDKELQFGGSKTLHPLFIPFARACYMIGGSMAKNLYCEFGTKGETPIVKDLIFCYQLKASFESQGFLPGTPAGMKDFLGTAGVKWMATKSTGISAKINYVGQLDKKILVNELYDVKAYGSIGVFTTF